MSWPSLESLRELDGARVLLRLDLNVPVSDGVVLDTTRIEAALPTLRHLLDQAQVVAACSHLGKPKGKVVSTLSLAQVVDALADKIGRPVRFVPACAGEDVDRAVAGAAPGSLLLLENLRFDPGEKGNDPAFAKLLAAPFSHYVNDAFGTAHRAHASVAGIPALFAAGKKAAGRLMERELSSLGRLVDDPEHPFTAVIGGAKVSTKTAPLQALVERVDSLAIGGGMANTFMLAQGLEVGHSLVEAEMVEIAKKVMARAAARGVDLLMPSDVVIADSLDDPKEIRVVDPAHVPADALITDIGPATRERYCAVISAARSVFWNGPMGIFETEAFAEGTMSLAHAVADCVGFSVVGGGESVMAVHKAGVGDRVDHVSTGGGASLELIAGKDLPAVVALED